MNSLNILVRSRSGASISLPGTGISSSSSPPPPPLNEKQDDSAEEVASSLDEQSGEDGAERLDIDEETPLLEKTEQSSGTKQSTSKTKQGWRIHHRIAEFVVNSVKIVIAAITAPGRYFVACFYDDDGQFSTFMPIRRLSALLARRRTPHTPAITIPTTQTKDTSLEHRHKKPHRRRLSSSSVISLASTSSSISDGEGEYERDEDIPSKHTRARSLRDGINLSDIDNSKTNSDNNNNNHHTNNSENRKSIRIQVQEESLRRRTGNRGSLKRPSTAYRDDVAMVASALKSPSSSAVTGKLTRYPRTPAPPRPLVPRRQPSYSLAFVSDPPKKTLIIDLDETLIHSKSQGGRMSTGHMVEVRLRSPVPSSGVSLASGVPILYYVHERPGCHEFLKKVCRWYNLVIFTASVQEYADPVIDWLERERKYFSKRYYRQHCTFRNGAYIKDLAQVEPDLSKVMILDNSPMSYVFHEDNAIPIEGWISDPTDNDLLHLVPLLEGLQYVTDVRALLALRQGQAQQA